MESGTAWPWPVKKIILIVGVGRSGSSYMGRLLGSCENTYYLYEPAILKYGLSNYTDMVSNVRSILFEDYLLPVVQGRYVNTYLKDDSCIFKYWAGTNLEWRRWNLNRRRDALDYLKAHPPTVIMKTLESNKSLAHLMLLLGQDVEILECVRNGYDVIGSSISRGWYTDEWLENLVDYTYRHKNCKIPWYIPTEYHEAWDNWNQATRIACVWMTLVGVGSHLPNYRMARLEELEPVKITQAMGLIPDVFVAPIFEPRQPHEARQDIAEPVRERFLLKMKEFGYV